MPTSIPLTHAQKPLKDEVWQLHPTADGFELREGNGELISSIPASEAAYRFRFPSFWASVRFLEVQMPEGGTHYFEPAKETVAAVKEAVDQAAGVDPSAAATALRRKAGPALAAGLLALAAGVGLTVYTYMQAAGKPGGGRYFVMTGLIGGGLFSACRGLM
jgi:hypothetical protein